MDEDPQPRLNRVEEKVLDSMGNEGLTPSALAELTGLTIGQVQHALSVLYHLGFIEEKP